MVRVCMGADDPAESCLTLADFAEDPRRLCSRVDQGRLSRSRLCDQVAEDPEMTHQDLIDLKAHVTLLSLPSGLSKTGQNPIEMYFFLDIRRHYKIIYKDIKTDDVLGITKFLFPWREVTMAHHEKRGGIFTGEISEKTVQKWRVVQIAAILPLILSVVLMLRFKGSILGTVVFFLILIVGILLPQIYRDLILSHIILKEQIDSAKGAEGPKDT